MMHGTMSLKFSIFLVMRRMYFFFYLGPDMLIILPTVNSDTCISCCCS